MDNNNYVSADLDLKNIAKVKSLESELLADTDKKIIVIAYEQNEQS